MPEQLLHNLDVCTARRQERCACVAQCMPPDLFGDADTSRNLTDLIARERLSPVRLSALAVRAGKDPVPGAFVLRVNPPGCEARTGSVERVICGRQLRSPVTKDQRGTLGISHRGHPEGVCRWRVA
jgi:hypothetical protein